MEKRERNVFFFPFKKSRRDGVNVSVVKKRDVGQNATKTEGMMIYEERLESDSSKKRD